MNDMPPTSMTTFMRDYPTNKFTNHLHPMTDMQMHPLTTGYQTPAHPPMIKNSLTSFLPMPHHQTRFVSRVLNLLLQYLYLMCPSMSQNSNSTHNTSRRPNRFFKGTLSRILRKK